MTVPFSESNYLFVRIGGVICSVSYTHLMPVDIMCDRANLALHSVKGDYNTHFALYDSDMHQTFLANHELVGEGERALREGRFEPFVQPVFCLLYTSRCV